MPARISTAQKVFGQPPLYMQDRNINAFAEALITPDQTEPIFPEWRQITAIFGDALSPVWRGESAVKPALETMARQIDALLGI